MSSNSRSVAQERNIQVLNSLAACAQQNSKHTTVFPSSVSQTYPNAQLNHIQTSLRTLESNQLVLRQDLQHSFDSQAQEISNIHREIESLPLQLSNRLVELLQPLIVTLDSVLVSQTQTNIQVSQLSESIQYVKTQLTEMPNTFLSTTTSSVSSPVSQRSQTSPVSQRSLISPTSQRSPPLQGSQTSPLYYDSRIKKLEASDNIIFTTSDLQQMSIEELERLRRALYTRRNRLTNKKNKPQELNICITDLALIKQELKKRRR
jgi:hypothetical protein